MKYECHGHIILDGAAYTGAVARHEGGVCEQAIRANLTACAVNGILFYRDGGDKHMVSAFAKKIAPEYGIDYRTPVYIIHKKGHYGAMFGRSFDTMSDYRELIRTALQHDADFIKITASGMLDFAGTGSVTGLPMPASELREMIKIAKGEGFSVMTHVNGADNIKNALESGADSIEHGFYIDREAMNIMVQTGAVWVPTCATVSCLIGSGRYDDAVLQGILTAHLSAIAEAAAAGVLIACGSDAGASMVPQGEGAIIEDTLLQSIGICSDSANRRIAEIFKRK